MEEVMRRALVLPPQASSMAREIDVLHYIVIGTAMLVAAASAIAIVVFLVRFRLRPEVAHRPRGPLHPRHEVMIALATLGVFLVFWVAGYRQFHAVRTPPPNAQRIYVIAKQWMWEAVYSDGTGVQTDIRVPVGQPVELLLTSRDVIHSFYVPAFRLKQDVLPGRITSMWFTATQPGRHDILCAEYCGTGHSRMRGSVIALSPGDYAAWLAGAGRNATELAAAGERFAAQRGCLRCHTVDGTPHLGPTWAGLYGSRIPLAGGGTVIATEAYLTESMMDPNSKLHAGFPPIMPSYFGQLPGPEAAAIVEYIRTLRRPQ